MRSSLDLYLAILASRFFTKRSSNIVAGCVAMSCRARGCALGRIFRDEESSDAAIETRRLAGDVGGPFRSQLRIAISRQLLRVSGDRGQGSAKLQRHLGGNLAMQLLLAADTFKFAAI